MTFVCCVLLVTGLPPLPGFLAKFALLATALDAAVPRRHVHRRVDPLRGRARLRACRPHRAEPRRHAAVLEHRRARDATPAAARGRSGRPPRRARIRAHGVRGARESTTSIRPPARCTSRIPTCARCCHSRRGANARRNGSHDGAPETRLPGTRGTAARDLAAAQPDAGSRPGAARPRPVRAARLVRPRPAAAACFAAPVRPRARPLLRRALGHRCARTSRWPASSSAWSADAQVRSGFLEIPLDLRDDHGLAVLACIVTSTPGTVWAGLSPDRATLTLHVLDLRDEDAWIRTIKQRYERR